MFDLSINPLESASCAKTISVSPLEHLAFDSLDDPQEPVRRDEPDRSQREEHDSSDEKQVPEVEDLVR